MSDTLILGKRRTVRFTSEIDRLLEAKASAENKSVSDIIRVSVKARYLVLLAALVLVVVGIGAVRTTPVDA